MSANPVRPLLEPMSPVTPVAAGPDAATGTPTPQQLLALLARASAETARLREQLHALTVELETATQHLAQHFGEQPRLTAVGDQPHASGLTPALHPLGPASPAMSVAIEMAVVGYGRDEVRARLTDAFAIAEPDAIVDAVFGPATA